MIDLTFFITIIIIFLGSLLGAWLRSRSRDACLAAFEDYHVTLEMDDGHRVWGRLDVLPTGLEFHYRSAIQDEKHLESSYLLYSSEYEHIQAIYRYGDNLDTHMQTRRAKEIQRSFHPNIFRRTARNLRNFINTASDSMSEVIGLAVGRARKPAGRFIDETSETHLRQIGSNVLGHVGQDADPLLERLIGQKIVFETIEDGVVHEHVGIFKNYTRDFYEIVDVQFPCREKITIEKQRSRRLAGLEIKVEKDKITVKNNCTSPVLLHSLKTETSEQLLDVVVDVDGDVAVFSEHPFTKATLNARIIRELDIILPRTRSVIRHRAEVKTKLSLTDIIFDVGVLLPLGDRQERIVAELRKKLAAHPNDAHAMATLGAQLMKLQQFDEAEELLAQAYALRYSLPDNGRGVELRLAELRRRQERKKQGSLASLAPAPPTAPSDEINLDVSAPSTKSLQEP